MTKISNAYYLNTYTTVSEVRQIFTNSSPLVQDKSIISATMEEKMEPLRGKQCSLDLLQSYPATSA